MTRTGSYGRPMNRRGEVAHRKVVIIDDSLARELWPGANPIGKKLNVQNGDFVRDVAEVVGVVKHVQYWLARSFVPVRS